MSVFSNYLNPYIEEGILQDVDQTKPSNVYAQLSIAYNQGSIGVMNATRWFVPYYEEQDPDDFDEQLLYDIWSNNHLQELIKWFNSKVIPEFTTMSYQTINVIIRIFCSKLNKLVDEGLVSKETAIKIHLNLVETIKEEHTALINEDLPFQGCPLRQSLMTTAHNGASSGIRYHSVSFISNEGYVVGSNPISAPTSMQHRLLQE